MNSASPDDTSLRSFRKDSNKNSPDMKIQSSEFRINPQTSYDDCEENLDDENEELVQSSDMRSSQDL
jgi:hypothetical protein